MKIYDFIGIGFGPANIALAIALEETGAGSDYVFLERNLAPGWQHNMLLADSDIQNHPLRDLVTPANPRSHYSFTNYLFTKDRLYDFLNLGITFPLRREYADYVVWVANHFSGKVDYGVEVTDIAQVKLDGQSLYRVGTATRHYLARAVVLAPGRTPNIPDVFDEAVGEKVFHLTQYEQRLSALAPRLADGGAIAVVGGSQSAVELVLDLAARFPTARIHSVHRSYAFRQKDTSPFSEEIYFPEFVDYYFNASPEGKKSLNNELKFTNYSSADADVIHRLYMKLYAQRLEGGDQLNLHRCTEVLGCERRSDRYELLLKERLTGERQKIQLDGIVLATGFKNFGRGVAEEPVHPLMAGIRELFVADHADGLKINRDYSMEPKNGDDTPPFFLNGLCESSHGFGDAGSFSILSLRGREICAAIKAALASTTGAFVEA